MNVPPKGNTAFRLGAYFETLKVSQQPVPNLTVRIAEGAYWVGGNTLVEFVGGNTAVMVPPGAGLAVWVLVALTSNAGVQLVYGVPAATSSPPAPSVPAGYIPLAYVYLVNGTTAVTNDMIFDERPLWAMQTSFVPLAGATMTGPLILNGNPTAAMGAATKQYVDSQDVLHPTFTDLANGLLVKADIDGTPSDTFVLNNDWVGPPSTNVFFGVDRGTQPNTYLRWNEGIDVWELTNDGSTYSDILTSGSIAGLFLPITGGTLTGALVLAAAPVIPLGAATKGYVDTAIAGIGTTYVDVAGDTMTGTLIMSGAGVQVVLPNAPILGTDATNKTYVDTADALKVNKADTLELTGDVTVPVSALTGPANSFGTTLATTGVVAAAYGSATQVGTFTVDAKGRLTLAANTAIAITGAAVTVGAFTSGHVVTLDASGHPIDSGTALSALAVDSTVVHKSGDTMSGNLAMGGFKVTGLASGTVTGDALHFGQISTDVAPWLTSVVTKVFVDSPYPVAITNEIVLADAVGGPMTVNLPTPTSGRRVIVKKIDASANVVTVDTPGAETIDGAGTFPLSTQYDSVTVVADGANWFVV